MNISYDYYKIFYYSFYILIKINKKLIINDKEDMIMKSVRKAVRTFLIQDNKVLARKYIKKEESNIDENYLK